MRLVENFNQDWLFIAEEVEAEAPDNRFEAVTLPHTSKLFPQLFVDNAEYQFVSTYRKRFTVPESAVGKQIFLDFDGAMLKSTAYLNGALLGTHRGGYTPFSYDLSDHLVPGENLLTVYVDGTEDTAIPPYGGRVDYLTFAGLYRDVWLRIVDSCHIVDTFVKTFDVLTSPRLECDVQLSGWTEGMSLEITLKDSQGKVVTQKTQAVDSEQARISISDLTGIALWSLENPALYTLDLVLTVNGEGVDNDTTRFGFRSAEFRKDGSFVLNGEAIKLFGLNRHQIYPYIGVAAPDRLQKLDADILKFELGCNIVRTSHYPQSPHFLDRCDEIGLLVFEETPGWQHIGDEEWQCLVLEDVQTTILRDRNHPSIILWGVRVNESPDHDVLYGQTNAVARQLDPTRPTGGVRMFIASNFLEDVFTLNDFPEGMQNPRVRPHLVTEFGGHMFPTKSWDNEERRVEQAMKHARKQSLQMGHPDIAGAIGWCAFDYHTHQEFGSGDRICYHGVMDIYRLPKFAAYFYRSQKSPQDEVVLQAATNWTMGDRSGGGNNPLVIFSNCEKIEVVIGGNSHGFFEPDSEAYPHLPHPPFIVRWPEPYNPWGTAFSDLEIRGYIGEAVAATHKIAADHLPKELRLTSHTETLKADGADMARIVVQILDKYGNVLPYQMRVAELTIEGEADLIGETPLPLLGGQAACFIKARKSAGSVTIRAKVAGLSPASLTLKLVD